MAFLLVSFVTYKAAGLFPSVSLLVINISCSHIVCSNAYEASHFDQVVDKVKDSLHSGVKLAVFDHLPSGAACVLPIRELSQLCHDRYVTLPA